MQPQEGAATGEFRPQLYAWMMNEKSLDTSLQYLISLQDAAAALAVIAFTFPAHRNRVHAIYTEVQTMDAIEKALKENVDAFEIDFSRVDALNEEEGREFWKIAYWTKNHMKQFLESSVEMTSHDQLPQTLSFEEIVGRSRMTLDTWAQKNRNCFTQSRHENPQTTAAAASFGLKSHEEQKPSVGFQLQQQQQQQQQEEEEVPP